MLKDTRNRVVLLIVIVILVSGGIFAYFKFQKQETELADVGLGRAPLVESIPGQEGTPAAYRAAVETANIAQVKQAVEKGESAVPTIVHPTYQGSTGFPGQSQSGAPGCGPDE